MTEAGRRISRDEIRSQVAGLLASDAFEERLESLLGLPERPVCRVLMRTLANREEETRTRAAKALGFLVGHMAARDLEGAREMMRRLMWMLNDESGSTGWGAAETMAYAMANHDGLAREYLHMLVSYIREEGNFLEEVHLQRELLRAIGGLAAVKPDLFRDPGVQASVARYAKSEDRQVRELAAWCGTVLREGRDGG